jgi:lipid-binding SYLF domain-containing protein
MWEKTKRYSKKGFDKTWDTIDKLGAPVNRLSNKLGAEAFWPMAIDKESDKAARILRSFCKDGFYAAESEEYTDADGKINRPKGKQRVVKKIPAQVVKNAKGLAIFTTMRTGLWVSGSGGSGVLLARIPETGEWSPPSGIMLHTAGIGFLAGVDIYDCVVVINTYEALEGFKKVRCTLGGEVSVSAGPVGAGGVLDSEVHKRQAPVWTYMKSKGLYAGVAVDGTIVIERTDENEKFYGERISVSDILAGKARNPPDSLRTLHQTIKAAQGDTDVDEEVIPPPGEAPGDINLQDTEGFGVPAADDPDPYGVKALEAEGLFIREASTKVRASPENFQFKPSIGSPVYATFRRSLDSSRNSWRASVQSYTSVDRGTQTDEAPLTATTSVSRASSRSAKESTGIPVSNWDEDAQWDTVPIHGGEEEEEERKEERELSGAPHRDTHESDDDVEVHEVSNVAVSRPESKASSIMEESDSKRTSPTFTRARLVTIPKRPTPPALPPRHPRHTWGSGSSRESPSPTARSHSTEPTDVEYESVHSVETVQKPSALPSNVKMLQANTVLPAVVNEDDDDLLDESESEFPADRDEFLSANGDDDDLEESNTPVKDMTPAATADSDRKESVSAISAKSGDTIEPKDAEFAEKLDESLCLAELEDKVHGDKAEGEAIVPASTATTADSEGTPTSSHVKSDKQDLAHISADVA